MRASVALGPELGTGRFGAARSPPDVRSARSPRRCGGVSMVGGEIGAGTAVSVVDGVDREMTNS
jgi:hypothetical protein